MVTVVSTVAGIDVTVNGGGNDDTFIVGASGSTKGLLGGFGFDGGTGTNTLTVDDSATATPDIVTVTATSIGGASNTLFPPGVSVGMSNIGTLSLLTGTAADTVTVTPSPNTAFIFNAAIAGPPDDTINVITTGLGNKSFTGTPANGGFTATGVRPLTYTNFEIRQENGSVSGGALDLRPGTYTVAESGGTATITVNRTGVIIGTVSATVTPSNRTATSPGDYDATPLTVTLAENQTTATVNVPIVNDALDEADETVTVTLSGPTGGATLGTQTIATLTIQDDDVATPTPTPTASTTPTGTLGRRRPARSRR